nr:MAG TPA: hypothetical protein [Caudoviricetes sp.]
MLPSWYQTVFPSNLQTYLIRYSLSEKPSLHQQIRFSQLIPYL